MSKRDIASGKWTNIETESQFQHIKTYGLLNNFSWAARIQRGNWDGPGKYLLLSYSQKCPRGCCYDDVYELLSSTEVANEVKDSMRELADLLKAARS